MLCLITALWCLALPVELTEVEISSRQLRTGFLHRYENGSPSRKNSHLQIFKTPNDQNAVQPPFTVGSFNVQTLSSKKFNNPNVMAVVEKVILRYDLILIMEIMMKDYYFMTRLLMVINRLAPDGVEYNMTLGSAHPATRELCAFFYRTGKLKLIHHEDYPDFSGTFYRKPFIVRFQSFTLRDMNQFVAVGHHVKPSAAVEEINALANVYDYIKSSYGIEDVLLMGDFNADCTYVKEQDWSNIALWTRLEFTWPIQIHVDTTTNHKSCALDRFVLAGDGMSEGVIMSSAQPFRFQEAYGLTTAEAREVSDHLPIEMKIRGKLSINAERHLTSNMCVSISDNRTSAAAVRTLDEQAKVAGFTVVHPEFSGKILRKDVFSFDITMETLETLHQAFPETVTLELQQGIIYKVSQDSLQDKSSHAELAKQAFSITLIFNKISTVVVCSLTTIN